MKTGISLYFFIYFTVMNGLLHTCIVTVMSCGSSMTCMSMSMSFEAFHAGMRADGMCLALVIVRFAGQSEK